MKHGTCRNVMLVATLALLTGLSACRSRKSKSAPKSDAYADSLKPIVASHRVQVLRFPDFADYAPMVDTFYDDRNYEVAWIDDAGKPTPQAQSFIYAFKHADQKGLKPEDYNASRWDTLTQKLGSKNDDDIAQFDAAMTVSVMRFLSDLHQGRVNPTHFNFDIDTASKKLDLPQFVGDNAVDAADVNGLIRSVEPDSDQYRALENALPKYILLAQQQAGVPALAQPLPTVAKPITVGGTYGALVPLAQRLMLEGDLNSAPPTPDGPAATSAYTQALSDAVKNFQSRHGITPDGKLTPQTIDSLNVPMTARIQQIDDSLERWRWLPDPYVNASLMVNLPEFLLRGYSDQDGQKHHLDFTMKVVDGKVQGDHDTPVFSHMMKYLIFRPYWNVPVSIIKKELSGHIEKSGVGYLAAHHYETTDNAGHVVEASAAQVEHLNVNVREKPGPTNSLGLIKFMFPNIYDIYLHSTPEPLLFNRTRRDFSHGCVRVQKPADLAVWVLRNEPGDWDLDKVNDQMQTGPDNHQVNLKTPIPVVIFYLTAHVGEDGQLDFFDDIYSYDKELDETLARGMPYPSQPQKISPSNNPEGTY